MNLRGSPPPPQPQLNYHLSPTPILSWSPLTNLDRWGLVTNRGVLETTCNNWHLFDRSAMIRLGCGNPTSEVDLVRLVDRLIAYEEGQITGDEEIAFFEHLVETGTCWQLQGHYQRVAATLIEAGLIKPPVRAEVSTTNN